MEVRRAPVIFLVARLGGSSDFINTLSWSEGSGPSAQCRSCCVDCLARWPSELFWVLEGVSLFYSVLQSFSDVIGGLLTVLRHRSIKHKCKQQEVYFLSYFILSILRFFLTT